MALNRLSTARRELAKIEQRLSVRQRLADRPPAVIVAVVMYTDGCVPDVTDRPLEQWELFKDQHSVVVLDPIFEWALRLKLTTATIGVGPEVDSQPFEAASVPEAPAHLRIPREVFLAWFYAQREQHGDKVEQITPNRTL